jgi:hypothetical protein
MEDASARRPLLCVFRNPGLPPLLPAKHSRVCHAQRFPTGYRLPTADFCLLTFAF